MRDLACAHRGRVFVDLVPNQAETRGPFLIGAPVPLSHSVFGDLAVNENGQDDEYSQQDILVISADAHHVHSIRDHRGQ